MASTNELLSQRTYEYVPDGRGDIDDTARRTGAVVAALSRLSRDMPRRLAVQVTANPVATSAVSGWVDEWSWPIELEWPILTTTAGLIAKQLKVRDGNPAVTVDREAAGSWALRFPGVPISASAPGRLVFASIWTAPLLPAAPAPLEDACVILASSILARALAGVYEGGVFPAPAGRSLQVGGDKATRYATLATSLMAAYEDLVGLEPRNPITLRRAGEAEAGGP